MGTSNEPKTLECKPATSGGSKIDVCSPTTLFFFPEVAQMGLYDDACYPLAVLHWKKCDCRKNMETSTCDKKNEGCRQQSYDKNQQRNGAQSWDFNQYPYRDAATKQKHKSNYINY
jgi:hypothetical protein